jgi:hypothetical protein
MKNVITTTNEGENKMRKYEQLEAVAYNLKNLCELIYDTIQDEALFEGLIKDYIDDLETGDYSIMSALRNALDESNMEVSQ